MNQAQDHKGLGYVIVIVITIMAFLAIVVWAGHKIGQAAGAVVSLIFGG